MGENTYIEGGAMGATNEQLKGLHEFANEFKDKKQQEEIYRVKFLKKIRDDYEEKFKLMVTGDEGEKVEDIGDGEFLVIQKSVEGLSLLVTRNPDLRVYSGKFSNHPDEIELFEEARIDRKGKLDNIYIWNRDGIAKSIEDGTIFKHAKKIDFNNLDMTNPLATESAMEVGKNLIQIKKN